jgi:long-chain acyl-CoA synthetase
MSEVLDSVAPAAGRAVRALDAATLCEAFQLSVADYGDLPALRLPGGSFEISWREYGERVRRTAAGLEALGVGRGDTFALMLTNRPEFHIVDSAAMHLGATAFSIYNTSAPEQIEYLLGDAANSVVVTEKAFLDRILEAKPRIETLEHVVVVDGPVEGALTLEEVDALGEPDFDFDAAWRSVEPEDVLTLIYTSGTTGPPKGVQLTHNNMMSMVRLWEGLAETTGAGQRLASYLPMAHIAERGFSHYHAIPRASTVTSIADPAQVIPALQDIRPTWFVGVPRVWEKLKAALEAGFAAEPDGVRLEIERAFEVGLRRTRAELAGEPIDSELASVADEAEEQVFSKLREQLGFDGCEAAFVGAAPTPVEVLEFFFALGVPIYEVWGMSETSAVMTANPVDGVKIGTVGKPLPGTELRLADDGEILVRGPNVMLGYRNQPEKTREAIDEEGWLRTGDVGELDEDGYLRIVDRKKELIINAAGKNMSPANIEARIKSASPLIGQAVAIGDRRPYNVALITLDPDGLAGRDPEDPAVIEEVREAVGRANAQLSRVEQIKRYTLLPEEWLPGEDELTPTMKLKRKPIAEKYAAEIEALYN